MGWLHDLGNQISADAQRLADETRNAAIKANESRKRAEQAIKDAAGKADALAKKLAADALAKAKSDFDKFKELNKRALKKLNDLTGRVRGAYKKLLRKAILKMVYNALKGNIHLYATRLYPAIAPSAELKAKGFSAKYQPKSVKTYNEILSKWIEMGGDKSKLDEAIRLGAGKRVLKFRKNPYSPDKQIYRSQATEHRRGIDSTVYNLEGDEEEDMSKLTAGADVNTEKLTPEESADLSDAGVTDAEPAEKHKHWHAFMAFMHHVFHKHDASNESPYVPPTGDEPAPDGSPDKSSPNNYDADVKLDKSNTDALAKTPMGDVKDILDTASPKTSDPKDKGESKVMVPTEASPVTNKRKIATSAAGSLLLGTIAFFAFPSKRKFAIPAAMLVGAGVGYWVAINHKSEKPLLKTPVDPDKTILKKK